MNHVTDSVTLFLQVLAQRGAAGPYNARQTLNLSSSIFPSFYEPPKVETEWLQSCQLMYLMLKRGNEKSVRSFFSRK